MANTISKYYNNILGLDLRVSDLTRNSNAATGATNVLLRQTGALTKRNGFQINTEIGTGGAGLIKYNNVDLGTGTITEELLSIDDSLYQYTQQTFTITYTGSNTAYYDLYLDPDTAIFKFDMYDNNANVLALDLGTGEEASPVTISNLKTNVDAVSDFSMAITDAGSTPAAYSKIVRSKNLDSIGVDNYYYTWELIPSPGTYTTPFTAHWATRQNADFEIASHAQLLDVLYIANGYDALHKYDGNRIYKAGLPKPTTPTEGVGAGSALTAGNYSWKYTYEHTDAKQNILTSKDSSTVSFTSAGSDSRTITMTHLTAASGYGTAEATCDSTNASTLTISVATGHDLLAGDEVYINDSISGEVVKRSVVSVTATTVVVDSLVGVTSGDTISQTKLTLWRTKSGGAIYYLVKEFVNDATTATVAYDDVNADSAILIDKIDSIKIPELPPSCRYIDVWRGQLVMTGDRENVNTVYYSDFDGESFPTDQSFITEARLGGGNSGIKSLDNTLFVFKPRSIITCTGDLGTDQFQIDGMADDGVGCVANATIKELEGRVWFLGKLGIYSVNREGPKKESEVIEPKFPGSYSAKRAIAHYWIEKDLYMIHLPIFTLDGSSNKYMETTSFILVYDLYRQAWYEWNTINFTGGIAEYNGNIYTSGFAIDPSDSLSKQYTYKLLDTGSSDDYADHVTGISFNYKTHWEALGEPSIFKKFLRIKVHSLDGTINDFESDKFQLAIDTEHDYRPVTEASLSLDFSGGIEGWGITPWGHFNWGESRLEQLMSKLSSKKAKSLRVIFSNSEIHQNILISGYELEIAAPYDIQLKE